MLRINTLGCVQLLDSGGSAIHRIMHHDKRVALLIYLLIARPRTAHRRDALLPLFWPEHDSEHARNALRQALHLLRRTLGDDAVIASNESVSVNTAHVTCDVLEFEALLDAGDTRAAIDQYRGPLLPGFFLAGAQQFESWLESERERLQQRAVQCLLELANQARDDHEEAVTWLRRAERMAPFEETIVRELMRRHLEAGNPGLALCAFDQLVERMAKVMETNVSGQSRALALAIRQQHPVASLVNA